MDTENILSYKKLIEDFMQDIITGSEFEHLYLKKYKSDNTIVESEEIKIFDNLFFEIDAYVSDDRLREDGDLNDSQLRNAAKSTIVQIEKLLKEKQ